jgi:hypothetical protein
MLDLRDSKTTLNFTFWEQRTLNKVPEKEIDTAILTAISALLENSSYKGLQYQVIYDPVAVDNSQSQRILLTGIVSQDEWQQLADTLRTMIQPEYNDGNIFYLNPFVLNDERVQLLNPFK